MADQSPSQNEGFHILDEFVCRAILDHSATLPSPSSTLAQRAESEETRLAADLSVEASLGRHSGKASRLQRFVGRRALYLEGGTIVVVRIESAVASPVGMTAIVTLDRAVSATCQIRRVRQEGEDLVETWGEDCPFGEQWSIGEGWPFLEVGEDRWGASQVGFRLLFSEDAISRFVRHDISWIDEYY